MPIFVQLGATRDGLDPYLSAAKRRGMTTVLVETPDYILFRKTLQRQEFDLTLPVEHPAHVEEVLDALRYLPEVPLLLLAGFERYIYSAYNVAKSLHILPSSKVDTFTPPDKAAQRALITKGRTGVKQPGYRVLDRPSLEESDIAALSYPVVVKPTDGGGGLGVFLAHNFVEVSEALSRLNETTNYDGEAFTGVLIEEFLPGIEYSVQGIACNGVSHILTFSKKCILTEPIEGEQGILGFRETGHIAAAGTEANEHLRQFVQACVEGFAYRNGPFHIDLVQFSGEYYFIEAGFRLSGNGVVPLVERVSGYNWAEEVFALYTDTRSIQPVVPGRGVYVGQLTVVSDEELAHARQLQTHGHDVVIQLFASLQENITARSLASDLSRHAGALGRVTLQAASLQEVEQLLQQCSPTRAVFNKFV